MELGVLTENAPAGARRCEMRKEQWMLMVSAVLAGNSITLFLWLLARRFMIWMG